MFKAGNYKVIYIIKTRKENYRKKLIPSSLDCRLLQINEVVLLKLFMSENGKCEKTLKVVIKAF